MPRRLVPGLALFVILVVAGACRRDPTPDVVDVSASARAQAVLGPFKTDLQRALLSSLADGGPESAIDVCAVEAPRLAARASKDGVRVGRAAVRRRNPGNEAPAWAAGAALELATAPREGAHRVVAIPDGRTGYVEAIVTKPVCLTCHGESITPSLAARIAARYPDDKATGFREGDLRGVFWVELPPQAAR